MGEWIRHSHCSYCGAPFAADQGWPRRCARCGQWTYRNPLPVSVILLPVGDGLLVVRRGLAPAQGQLALPGGFIELPESWQEAGARELREETGVVIDPNAISPYRVYSAPDGTLLIFGLAPPWHGELPRFTASAESSERLVIDEPQELAFSLHTRVAAEYFEEAAQGAEPAGGNLRRTS